MKILLRILPFFIDYLRFLRLHSFCSVICSIVMMTLTFGWSNFALACPMCAGSDPKENNPLVPYLLISFIVFIYIVAYILYRTIRRYSSLNHMTQLEIDSRIEKNIDKKL